MVSNVLMEKLSAVEATMLKFDSVASCRAIIRTGAGCAEQPHCMFTRPPTDRFAPFAEKLRFCVAAGGPVSER